MNIAAGLIRQDVPEFQVIPWWMGIAYRRYDRLETVCYVVPLNWVVCLGLWVWWRLKRLNPKDNYWLNGLQQAAYQIGYERGYERGYSSGSEAGLQTGLRRQAIEEIEDRRKEYLRGKSGAEEVGPGPTATGIEGPQGGVRF